MANNYDDDDSGALFRVTDLKSPKHPTFTGTCTIEGKKYRIAGWGREIQKGERYLKLKFTVAEEQPAAASRPAPPHDDDIAF